jgi:hypothetical protein
MSDETKIRLSTPREPVNVPLEDPIQAHGEEMRSLTLRAPTGKDIRELGYPSTMLGNGDEMKIATDVVAKYVARLAGIPLPSVDALAAPDFNACITTVMGFFPPSRKASSTDISSSPDGGATSPASSI